MVPGVVVTAVPSYDIVTTESDKKSEPVTVTVVPNCPLVGFSDIVDSCNDEACGIMLLLSDTDGIERITIRRTTRDSNGRLNLLILPTPFRKSLSSLPNYQKQLIR